MPGAVLKVLDTLLPSATDRLIARAFSRPRRRAIRPREGQDPLHLACLPSRHPSGCAVWGGGRGATVLLVHGWEADHRDLEPFAHLLLANGFRVMSLDLPAHGATPGRSATIPELAEAIGQAIEYPVGLPVQAIVAHSLGGAAALRALAASSRRIPLALIASPTRAPAYLARMIEGFGLAPHRLNSILEHYRRRHHIDLATIDAAVDAPKLDQEVLLIYGNSDRLVPPSEGERYKALLPGADLHVLPGLGHRGILLDERVHRLTLEFVRRAAAKRRVPDSGRLSRPVSLETN